MATRAYVPLGLAAGVAIAACSSGAPTGQPPPPPRDEDPARPDQDQPGAALPYDVHEWGLVRALPGDIVTIGAIAPPPREVPLAVEKPVLYFHPMGPLALRRVAIDALGGAIVEAWPPPAVRTGMASQLDWRNLRLDPDGPCNPSPLPSPTDGYCQSLPAGDPCETPSLATVRVPYATCVHVGTYTDSLLFYRMRTRSFAAPLRFTRRAGSGDVEVSNTGTLEIPGWLVRLHSTGGQVRALAVRPPEPGQSIVVGPALGDVQQGRARTEETLRIRGLVDPEIEAFMRAWDPTLFGRGAAVAEEVEERTEQPPPPSESFLYFLPGADCERISTLTFDPQPRHVRRAIAVWSAL